MVDKQTTRILRDINNLMEPPSRPHQSNVFKRLSTSPFKASPNDLSKPPARMSPVKGSPSKSGNQLTPKRLASPDCLKNYVSKITQSMDRPYFEKHGGNPKIEDNGSVTNLVFPASPTRVTFSNERKIGGDGSLSKLRSRFTNGLLSPQRGANMPNTELHGKNLFSKLEDEEQTNDFTNIPKRHLEDLEEEAGPSNKRKQIKKTVKFELPAPDEKENLRKQVQDLKYTLSKVIEHQNEMEVRLKLVESQQYDKKKS